jgi:ABC-type multidrug transport system fused ATPase/permease subunit
MAEIEKEIQLTTSSDNKSSFSKHFSKQKECKISLVWENVHLYVLSKDPLKSKFLRPVFKNKHILNGVTGKASSGELLAIMGPTGENYDSSFDDKLTMLPSYLHGLDYRLWQN